MAIDAPYTTFAIIISGGAMQWTRKLERIILCGLLCVGQLCAETKFAIEEGRYLWHVWDTPAYRQAFPDWAQFKAEVAELSGLPNADDAYHFLQPGFELSLPDLPQDTPSKNAVDVQQIKVDVRQQVEQEFAKERIKLQEEIKNLKSETEGADQSYFWVLAIALFLLGTAIFLHYLNGKKKMKIAELQEENVVLTENVKTLAEDVVILKKDKELLLKDTDLHQHFLKCYTVPYTLPADIGSVLGRSQTVYVLRATNVETVGPEDEVIVYNDGTLVNRKFKNLARFFDEAAMKYDAGNTDTLDFYGIVRSDKKPHVKPKPTPTPTLVTT